MVKIQLLTKFLKLRKNSPYIYIWAVTHEHIRTSRYWFQPARFCSDTTTGIRYSDLGPYWTEKVMIDTLEKISLFVCVIPVASFSCTFFVVFQKIISSVLHTLTISSELFFSASYISYYKFQVKLNIRKPWKILNRRVRFRFQPLTEN